MVAIFRTSTELAVFMRDDGVKVGRHCAGRPGCGLSDHAANDLDREPASRTQSERHRKSAK